MSFAPDPAGSTGTIRLSVGSQTKTFTQQKTPGGFGPYHYPWRLGWEGGGGNKCRDHAGEKTYDCGKGCNQFQGTFDYAALCTGHCQPGECLAQAAAEASNTGMLLFILLWCAGTVYIGGGVALGRRNGRTTAAAVDSARSSSGAALAKLLGAHPHWLRWVDCAALVADGAAWSAGRLRRGDQSSGRDGGYTPLSATGSESMPLSNSSDSSSGSRRERGRSMPEGSSKETRRSRTERATGCKTAHKHRQHSSHTDTAEIEGSQAEEVEERERILREQRSAGVHSSQQAIKVVGLSRVAL